MPDTSSIRSRAVPRKGTFARTIHCDLGFLPAIHISIINGHTGQRTIQIPAHKIRDGLAHSGRLHRRRILAYHLPFVNRHTRHRHRQASATNIDSNSLIPIHSTVTDGLSISVSEKTEDIPDNENDSSGAAPTYTTTRLDISFFLLDDKARGRTRARVHRAAPARKPPRQAHFRFRPGPKRDFGRLRVRPESYCSHSTRNKVCPARFRHLSENTPLDFSFCVTHADPQRQAEQKQS